MHQVSPWLFSCLVSRVTLSELVTTENPIPIHLHLDALFFFLVYMNYLWIDVKVVPYLSPTQGHCFWDYPFCMSKLINFPSLLHHCSQRVRSEVKVTQSWSDSLWPHGLYSSWNSPSRKTKIKLLVFSVCHLFPLKALHTNFLLDYDFLEELCIFTIFWSCFTISIALTTLVHY